VNNIGNLDRISTQFQLKLSLTSNHLSRFGGFLLRKAKGGKKMRIGFSCYSTETKFPSGGGVPEGRGGLWFAIIAAVFITLPSFATPTATDRKTVSSKAYVDTNVELKQPKIPAANINNATIGVSVVTYTGNEGIIGERQIYDGSSNYTSGDANKLVTASALNGTVTNLPTMETSKLTCANPGTCSLWTIVDQQVYGQNSNNNNNNSNSGSGTN